MSWGISCGMICWICGGSCGITCGCGAAPPPEVRICKVAAQVLAPKVPTQMSYSPTAAEGITTRGSVPMASSLKDQRPSGPLTSSTVSQLPSTRNSRS